MTLFGTLCVVERFSNIKCKILNKNFALLFFRCIFAVPNEGTRGVAQLASASGLGPEGPVFESQYPDIQIKKLTDFQWVSFYFDVIEKRPIIDI